MPHLPPRRAPVRRAWLAGLAGTALAAMPAGASAQDAASGSDPIVVEPALDLIPGLAEAPERGWVATVSGGVARQDGFGSGRFASVTLLRQWGTTYASAGVTSYRSTLRQADAAMPSRYVVGTVALGTTLSGWQIDGYASYGRQDYGLVPTPAGIRPSSGPGGSGYAAVGASLGRSLALSADWFATPSVSLSYARSKLLRPGFAAALADDFETVEPAWTGGAMLRADRRIGSGYDSFVGAFAALRLTSNARSELAAAGLGSGRAPGTIRHGDAWAEFGASATIGLSRAVWLEGFVSQTVAQSTGNSRTLGGSLRLRF